MSLSLHLDRYRRLGWVRLEAEDNGQRRNQRVGEAVKRVQNAHQSFRQTTWMWASGRGRKRPLPCARWALRAEPIYAIVVSLQSIRAKLPFRNEDLNFL